MGRIEVKPKGAKVVEVKSKPAPKETPTKSLKKGGTKVVEVRAKSSGDGGHKSHHHDGGGHKHHHHGDGHKHHHRHHEKKEDDGDESRKHHHHHSKNKHANEHGHHGALDHGIHNNRKAQERAAAFKKDKISDSAQDFVHQKKEAKVAESKMKDLSAEYMELVEMEEGEEALFMPKKDNYESNAHQGLKYHALTKDEAWRNAPEEAERAREKEKVKGKNVAPGYRAKRGKMLASRTDHRAGVDNYAAHLTETHAPPKPRSQEEKCMKTPTKSPDCKYAAETIADDPLSFDAENAKRLNERIRDDPRSRSLAAPLVYVSSHPLLLCQRTRSHVRAGFAAAAVRLLKLSDGDCRSLRSFFRRTDSDRSGKISVPEFIDLIGAKDSSFVRVLIDLMVFEWADLDADDQLNFDELLLAACVVCTLNENELMHVLFKVFDADRSGTVGHCEFARLASAIQDLGAMFPGNYMDFIDKFDGDGSGDVDFSEFLNIHRSFPMLFHPILALQDNFRKRTLGVERWKALNMAYVQSQATGIRYNSNNEKAGSVHAMNLTSALRDIGLDDIDQ